jgi:hypothetical protein
LGAMMLFTLVFWGTSRKSVCCYKAWNFYVHMMCWSPVIRLVFITYLYVCIAAKYGSPIKKDDFSPSWVNYTLQGYLCVIIAAIWAFFSYSED